MRLAIDYECNEFYNIPTVFSRKEISYKVICTGSCQNLRNFLEKSARIVSVSLRSSWGETAQFLFTICADYFCLTIILFDIFSVC